MKKKNYVCTLLLILVLELELLVVQRHGVMHTGMQSIMTKMKV